MKKIRLLTPGPTPVPERLSLRMARPIVHHRSPEFEAVFARVARGPRLAVPDESRTSLVFASSGTGAMEASFVNFLRKGDTVVVVDGGKFGERWGKFAKAYGVNAVVLKTEWGHPVEPAAVEKALRDHPAGEGRLRPGQRELHGRLPSHPRAGAGDRRGPVRSWWSTPSARSGRCRCRWTSGASTCWSAPVTRRSGFPRGLPSSPRREKAWKLNESADLPRFYFDVKRERENQRKNQTAWTPAITLVEGLDESLAMFREEGLANVFARHERMAKAARAGMQALGLTLFSKSPSSAMTTVVAPDGVDSEKLVKTPLQQYGIKLVGGQDAATGKIFRIAHLGYFDDFDMLVVIGAVERGLHDLGAKIELGAGLAAAQRSFAADLIRVLISDDCRRRRRQSSSASPARRWTSSRASRPRSFARSSAATTRWRCAAPPR